jgi:hypothetical protein
MRYYHYLSNNKIEMLYQQIAEYRPKVNTDVAIDLKVIKASRKSERSEGELSVYNKLSVVENWIYEHEPVGHASRPGAWIYGREFLGFTPSPGALEETVDSTNGSPVLFGGKSEDNSVILMCGSSGNLIQDSTKAARFSQWSSVDYLSRLFETIIAPSNELPAIDSDPQEKGTTPIPLGELHDPRSEPVERAQTLAEDLVSGYGSGRLGYCEFLAKRTSTTSHGDVHASMATPLFIALLD